MIRYMIQAYRRTAQNLAAMVVWLVAKFCRLFWLARDHCAIKCSSGRRRIGTFLLGLRNVIYKANQFAFSTHRNKTKCTVFGCGAVLWTDRLTSCFFLHLIDFDAGRLAYGVALRLQCRHAPVARVNHSFSQSVIHRPSPGKALSLRPPSTSLSCCMQTDFQVILMALRCFHCVHDAVYRTLPGLPRTWNLRSTPICHIHRRPSCVHVVTEFPQSTAGARGSIPQRLWRRRFPPEYFTKKSESKD